MIDTTVFPYVVGAEKIPVLIYHEIITWIGQRCKKNEWDSYHTLRPTIYWFAFKDPTLPVEFQLTFESLTYVPTSKMRIPWE